MSVKYKKVKNLISGSKTFGKWYGRAVVTNVVDVDVLSTNIGNRCTVTKPDIVAVVTALVEEMKAQLQQGSRVVLDDFGSFKVGMSTSPADTAKDFKANNVKKLRVLFQPTVTTDSNHKRVTNFLDGCKVEEMATYVSPDEDDTSGDKNDSDGGTTPGGGTTSGGSDEEG